MDIILLAAGSSKRMGKTNKLFLKVGDSSLIQISLNAALKGCDGKVILVLGYEYERVIKELEKSFSLFKDRIEIVQNPLYDNGQFSSTLVGLKKMQEGSDFYISLADLPFITDEHYKKLIPYLKNFDAVRPSYNGKPGHPVLLKSWLRNEILKYSINDSVKNILRTVNVTYPEDGDSAWVTDLDNQNDYLKINSF